MVRSCGGAAAALRLLQRRCRGGVPILIVLNVADEVRRRCARLKPVQQLCSGFAAVVPLYFVIIGFRLLFFQKSCTAFELNAIKARSLDYLKFYKISDRRYRRAIKNNRSPLRGSAKKKRSALNNTNRRNAIGDRTSPFGTILKTIELNQWLEFFCLRTDIKMYGERYRR